VARVRGKRPTSLRLQLAGRIRELRAEREMSQEALAAAAGLHRTYIGGVERGERNVSIDNIERIAKGLGCSACDLFGCS
jgi:transcriptional regulator with XRE-family HTH domain